MRVLGVVQWTTRDKVGSPIAGVRPLVEILKAEWRSLDAVEEFPKQGQVFWPNAQFAVDGALVSFNVASNPGQKDEFKVVDPKPVYEVLDLRCVGAAAAVRAALAEGVRVPGPLSATRVLVWCEPDLLVGPVELTRGVAGAVKLTGAGLARLPSFTCDATQVRSVVVDKATRLLRVDDGPLSGYVDWDEDATVLRRALEATVRLAKHAGRDAGQTKKQIEDAAKTLVAQGIGPDAKLDRYRVERALSLLADADVVSRGADELVASLREHPAIKASLDVLGAKVQADVEQRTRAELEHQLARERAALVELKDAHARTIALVEASRVELRSTEEQVARVKSEAASVAREVEAAVDAHVLAAIDRPLKLLAEVSVLRPLLGEVGARPSSGARGEAPPRVDWARPRGEIISDRKALLKALINAARVRGVDPELMLRIHAATSAGLMPITLGPAALAALTAYAHAACGGRQLIIHVSPSALQPRDLEDAPGGGIASASIAAKEVDGISLVMLEGANRSPLEASVVPLLQLGDLGLSSISSARGLRLASTFVSGATTVPVSSQIWSHAVAVYPEPRPALIERALPAGDLPLSSDLLAPADAPTVAVDSLLESWPECRDLRPTLLRLGAAVARLYEEEQRLAQALLHGIILPYVVTALSAEEQAEALSRAGDEDGAIASEMRRLRRRLC